MNTFPSTAPRLGFSYAESSGSYSIFLSALALGAVCFPQLVSAQIMVDLGSSAGFAVLAGAAITDAGGFSTVTGNVGIYPTPGIPTGLSSGQVRNGSIFTSATSATLLSNAQADLTIAYNDAAGRIPNINFGAVDNPLGGLTLYPGVYQFGHAATANLSGTLTLDAHGVSNPVWIFQATSDFVTAAGAPGSPASRVLLINGAKSAGVFWEVGSSATIGTYSELAGTIMADQSITLTTGAQLDGAALARIAAVTLDHNIITYPSAVPEPASAVAAGLSLVVVSLANRRRLHECCAVPGKSLPSGKKV